MTEEYYKLIDTLRGDTKQLYRNVRDLTWAMLSQCSVSHLGPTNLAQYQPVFVDVGLDRLDIRYRSCQDPMHQDTDMDLTATLVHPKGRTAKTRGYRLVVSIGHPSGSGQGPRKALLQARAMERCAHFGLYAEELFKNQSWTRRHVADCIAVIKKHGLLLQHAPYDPVMR